MNADVHLEWCTVLTAQQGSSFPVTVVGILMQLPSGLSNGGIFK